MEKECKLVCGNKTVAIFKCTKSGCKVKLTPEGKKLCKENCKCLDCCC